MTERTAHDRLERVEERLVEDIRSGPGLVWSAVALIVVGVCLCAAAIMAVVLWVGIAGIALIVLGGVLAVAGDIMSHAH